MSTFLRNILMITLSLRNSNTNNKLQRSFQILFKLVLHVLNFNLKLMIDESLVYNNRLFFFVKLIEWLAIAH